MDDSDYNKSMEQVRNELRELVEGAWGDFLALNESSDKRFVGNYEGKSVVQKASSMLNDTGFIANNPVKWRMDMLLAINDEKFYHATDFWKEISSSLWVEERSFYANIIIQQARKSAANGHSWLMGQYDNGNLKDYMNHSLLVESVNKGFWELAKEYLSLNESGILGSSVPWKTYNTLMKYSEHLDLTKFKELWSKTMRSRDGWPGKTYTDAYERAKAVGTLKADELGVLACPIVDRIFGAVCNPYNYEINDEAFLKKNLKPYSDVLNTPIVQKLLRDLFSDCIKSLSYDDNNVWYAELVEGYLKMTDGAKRNLASSSIDREDPWLIDNMIKSEFPANWLNDGARLYVQSQIVKSIDETYGKMSSTLPKHMESIKDGMKSGLLNNAVGFEKLERAVTFYIESKKRPSGEVAQEMYRMGGLEGIRPELVKRMRDAAMKDMLLRRVGVDVDYLHDLMSQPQTGSSDSGRSPEGVQLSFKGLAIRQDGEQSKSRSK